MLQPLTSGVREIGDRIHDLCAKYGDVDVVASQVLIALSESERDELVKYCVARFVADALDDRRDETWKV